MPYLIDLSGSECLLTQKPQIESAQQILVEGRFFVSLPDTSCPLQMSFSFLALFFSLFSIPAVFAFLCPCLSLTLSHSFCLPLSISVLLTLSLSSSLPHFLYCFHLPLFHFFFFLSFLTLLTISSCVLVFDCLCPPKAGLWNPQNCSDTHQP